MRKLGWIRWVVVAAWLAPWLYATRYAMLDDALIHLRYAAHLHDLHRITYDGVTSSYGTSSLLYVSLLAALYGFFSGPMLPKVVSVLFYLILVALLIVLSLRSRRPEPRFFWAVLLIATLTPMAIRWLTDGMETSLVVLASVVFTLAAERYAHAPRISANAWLGLVLMGLVLVLLRIEMALFALLATCAIFAVRFEHRHSHSSLVRTALESSPILAGAAVAALGVRLAFGSLLPDTAVAKSSVASLAPLLLAAHMVVSSFAFGCGVLALAAVSAWVLWRNLRRDGASLGILTAALLANASFPIVVALACLRGQAIQGIRYLLWPLFFSVAWNLLALDRLDRETSAAAPADTRVRPLAWAFAVLLLLLPLDWHYATHAMLGRAQTFLAMRDAGLDRYKGRILVAGDIGFIGYFTSAHICDLDGLVNGRAVATLPYSRRAQRCASQNPDLLFLTTTQQHDIDPWLDLAHWTPVRTFDFVNVGGNDRHILFLPRQQ